MTLCRTCNGKGFITIETENTINYQPCETCGNKVLNCAKDHKRITFYGKSELDCPVCAIKRVLQARELEIDKLQRKK